MGSTNHGNQDLTIEYYEEATSFDVNKRNVNVVPRGIYSGGHLTRVTDTEVTLSLFTAEIGDDDIQISVQTSAVATLNAGTLDSGNINESTPYLVLRWGYLAQQNNYVEIHAVASVSAAQDNDILIGKCVFSGATLTSFDYSDRTFLNVQDLFLRVEEDSGLYVWVRAGRIQNGSSYVLVPEQRVGPFTVPGSPNSRIDLVYIASDGTPTIAQGSVAVSPTAPNYGGRLVVAEVTIVNGDIAIAASRINDVRSFVTEPTIPDNVSIELTAAGKLALKDFASSFSGNGYLEFGGFSLQWGSVSVGAGATVNVNLSKEYPNNHLWATARPGIHMTHSSFNENASTGALPLSTSQIQIRNGYGAGGARTMYWLSIGN